MGKTPFFGGASAASGSQNGSSQQQIDAETKAFRDQLFGQFGDLTGNIFAQFKDGNGPTSFIPDQSADTQTYQNTVRNMLGQGSGNSALINAYGKSLANGAESLNVAGYTPKYIDSTSQYAASTYGPLGDAKFGTASEFAPGYQSSYLTGIVDPSLAQFDVNAERGLAGMRAARDAGTAFGGRARNADAVYMGESDRNRALLQSGLLKDAYTTSLNYGAGDAERKSAAALQGQSLESQRQEGNAARTQSAAAANVGALNLAASQNAGIANDALRYNNDFVYNQALQNQKSRLAGAGLLQSQDQADYSRLLSQLNLLGESGSSQDVFNQGKAREPLDLLGQAASILSGVPYGTNTTTQQKSTSKAGKLGAGG